jgi:hypothetical protein
MISNEEYISVDQYIETITKLTHHEYNKSTVSNWFDQDYILGARKNSKSNAIEIPKDTRAPYTIRRPHSDDISNSVINGVKGNYEVFGALYDMTEEMFRESIIEPLVEEKLIIVIEVKNKNYVYYRPTRALLKYKKTQLFELLDHIKPDISLIKL